MCTPESSSSRIGSIIEYGMVTCRSPPPPSSSILKPATTTISEGLTMLAKCGLTSEFRYSIVMSEQMLQASLQVGECLAHAPSG